VGQAHNHPYGCPCNWCNNYAGKGGGGSGAGTVASPLTTSSALRVAEVERPKTVRTRCPHCGDPVFFHRDWNGGCAWFDELGWPWDIHWCFKKAPVGRPPARAATSPRTASLGRVRVSGWDRASVVECVERTDGTALVMLHVMEPDVLLSMLAAHAEAPEPGAGWVRTTDLLGIVEFEPSAGRKSFRLCGPVFDCLDPAVWFSREGSPDARLALGRDLGVNRNKNYANAAVRYVAPRWREALRHYLPALFEGDEAAMAEALHVIEHPGKGVLPRAEELALLRLHRTRAGSADPEVREALYEEMLEKLRL
jgi:hypothetical protein